MRIIATCSSSGNCPAIIEEGCGEASNCPTVAEDDHGNFLIIGEHLDDASILPPGAGVGPGETLIRVPRQLLFDAAATLHSRA